MCQLHLNPIEEHALDTYAGEQLSYDTTNV